MNSQILQLYCVVSVHCLSNYLLVEETSGKGLSGCFESKTIKQYPNYEKIGEPKYFLLHDENCWIFSSDANGFDVRFRLRY